MLSKVWTVEKFFKHAAASSGRAVSSLAYAQRFESINLVQMGIVSNFYSLVYPHYMTPVVIVPDTGEKYPTVAATVSYDNTTARLTAASMNSVFTSADVGKYVWMKRLTTDSYYLATISAYVSGSIVVLSPISTMPSGATTGYYFWVQPVAPTGDYIDISGLNVMKSGDQVRLDLESSATNTVTPVAMTEMRIWNSSAPINKNTIIWCVSGEQVILKKSSDLTSFGLLVVRYPRVPTAVVADTDFLDIPDGPLITLGISLLKKMLIEKYAKAQVDMTAELTQAVQSVYQSYGVTVKNEDMDLKVKAIS